MGRYILKNAVTLPVRIIYIIGRWIIICKEFIQLSMYSMPPDKNKFVINAITKRLLNPDYEDYEVSTKF